MEEKILLLISISLFIFIIGFILFLYYHDMFKKVEIRTTDFQPFGFLYKSHCGNYRHHAKILGEVADYIKKTEITAITATTIYYQNTAISDNNKKHSEVGFMVAKSAYTELPHGIKYKKFDGKQYLAASYIYRNRFSILLGSMHIYPAFKKELKRKKILECEFIEIYDMHNKIIIYLMPYLSVNS